MEDPTKYGVVMMDEYGQVQRFVEKPKVRVRVVVKPRVQCAVFVKEPKVRVVAEPRVQCLWVSQWCGSVLWVS